MTVSPDDLTQLTIGIWQILTELDEPPVGAGPAPRGARIGRVEMHGAFEGAIEVALSESRARTLAERMFGASDLDADAVDDAVRELANIFAGNTKALLPSPTSLALPVLAEAPCTDPTPLTVAIGRVDDKLVVTLAGHVAKDGAHVVDPAV